MTVLPKLQVVYAFVRRVISSPKFFVLTVVLFALMAAWFALVAQYPMAFDEDYHYGIIKLYAGQWSPFFSTIPPNSGLFGNLTRDPSYLYHYLMSFPYRLTELIFHTDAARIIVLRFINIAIFVVGILIYRRLLKHLGASIVVSNVIFFVFAFIPIVPFLAATINYDNLLFLLTPLTLLLVLNVREALLFNTKRLTLNFLLFLAVGMLTCLVKYVFVPVFAIMVVYIAFYMVRNRKGMGAKFRESFMATLPLPKILAIILLVVAVVLFSERYGINLIKYHSVKLDCEKVESIEQCSEYGPWIRNYNLIQEAELANLHTDWNPVYFLGGWIGGMMDRLYFAINYNFYNSDPLPIPYIGSYILGGVGMLSMFYFGRKILRRHHIIVLPVLIIGAYVASLLYTNYTEYLEFDEFVAINGRYLVPFLPMLFLLFIWGYKELIDRLSPRHSTAVKTALVVILILAMLQGGGALGYLLQGDRTWFWRQSPVAQNVSLFLQAVVKPFVIGN